MLDISCAVHQGARFVSNPRFQHGKALKWLERYLVGSKDKGMTYSPSNQSFDVYADASFTGDWDPENSGWDPDTARSRTGSATMYASCPVIWACKLQTEIAFSTTESEYLAVMAATCEVLPLMELVQEMQVCLWMWFDCNSTSSSLSSLSRQQWHRRIGFKCQESENASAHVPHQHQVSSFQEQSSGWHDFNSFYLNRRHAC